MSARQVAPRPGGPRPLVPCRYALVLEGFVVVGDLHGRAITELAHHRNFGRASMKELGRALAELGVWTRPARTVPLYDGPPPHEEARIEAPAFALEYGFNELPLSGWRISWWVSGGRPAVLGDVNGRTASELSHVIAPSAIRELMSVLKVMAEDGSPAPMGILDVVDSLLDGLPEHRRQALLLWYGGTGESPMTLAE